MGARLGSAPVPAALSKTAKVISAPGLMHFTAVFYGLEAQILCILLLYSIAWRLRSYALDCRILWPGGSDPMHFTR